MTVKKKPAELVKADAVLTRKLTQAWQEGYDDGEAAAINRARDMLEERYVAGLMDGEKRMEEAKAGGILDLQRQLDAERATVTALRKQRRELVMQILDALGL
jgi:hypothetical protein